MSAEGASGPQSRRKMYAVLLTSERRRRERPYG